MEKIIRLSIENTTKIRQVEDSFCELYSHDKNNGAFEFEISKGTLTNENVVALFKFLRSGSYWKTNGTVEDNKIKFNFDTSLITQNEEVVCYIYLDKEERNSDIFRFKFKVNLSEIDKASQLPVKERFFANSMIVDRVDVLTKEDFDKAIKEIEKGSKFLTEAQANEKYALKGDIPNVTNLVSSTQLSDYALRTDIPNSETIVRKAVEEVEKKNYLTEHQSLAGYVTETQLEGKNYLTEHQDISKLATKKSVEDVEAKVTQLENRPVTSSYDDTEIKRKIKELEGRPTTANIDTSNFVTNTQLEDKHYLTEHQDISGLATKDELRKAFLDDEEHEKYAKKTELPQPYNDTDIKSRLTTLENRPAGNGGDVDVSNFITKQEVARDYAPLSNVVEINKQLTVLSNRKVEGGISSAEIDEIKSSLNKKIDKNEMPFKSTSFTRVEDYLNNTNEHIRYENFGRLYTDTFGNHLVVSGGRKTVKFETLLYAVGSSLPDAYEPDFEFSEENNIKFITTRNIHDYLPRNTGDTSNTTALDKRLKVLEAKQWEIHGRGMPNGVVTAPVGTTYVDEAVTNGALKWIKKSGTGNTGWEVLIGDTGWKIIPSVSKLGGSYVKIRRVNNIVSYQFGGLSWGWFGIVRRGGAGYQVQPSDRERNCFILGLSGIPIGYRSEASLIGGIYNDKGTPYGTWYLGGVGDGNMLRFQFTDPVPTDRDIGDIRVSSISYLTSDPWPAN